LLGKRDDGHCDLFQVGETDSSRLF
jgi:hypothetical protein